VGFCVNLILFARNNHLQVIKHLCLEIPQKKATQPTIFRNQPSRVLSSKRRVNHPGLDLYEKLRKNNFYLNLL
jgi:hypothetical protein